MTGLKGTLRTMVVAHAAAIVVCLGVGSAAYGDDASVARQHNVAAKRYFNLGKFADAAREYELAYEARPIPAFLYNLGQCYKRMAALVHLQKAKFYLESYLHNAPAAPNAAHVKEEIAELEREIARLRKAHLLSPAQREAATRPPGSAQGAAEGGLMSPAQGAVAAGASVAALGEGQAGQPNLAIVSRTPRLVPTPRPTPFYRKWWFWTAVGAVVVGAATATALALRADQVQPITGTMEPGQIDLE